MTYTNLYLWGFVHNMEKMDYFKFKVMDKKSGESLILTLDYTVLSAEDIQKIMPVFITNGNNRLLFLGNKDCELELTALYNIVVSIQSLLGGGIVWDIIDELLEKDEPHDLGGYLILNDK